MIGGMNFDVIADFFQRLAELAATAEPWQQFLIILVAGAVPFIESYLGSFLGVAVGVEPAAAVVAVAVLGNIISTFLLIAATGRVRAAAGRGNGNDSGTGSGTGTGSQPVSARRQKVGKYLEKLGVPGVSLLGPIILASQITGPTLVALGASKRSVYLFQGIAIIAWGVLFGFFGDLVISWYL